MLEKSQKGKVLTVMSKNPSKWFNPGDFMSFSLGEYAVGYEAHARLSELKEKGFVEARKMSDIYQGLKLKTRGQRRMLMHRITDRGLEMVQSFKVKKTIKNVL